MRDRAKLLTLFVRLLGALFKLNNLDGAMSILSGLRSAAINRLRFTYDMLPKPEAKARVLCRFWAPVCVETDGDTFVAASGSGGGSAGQCQELRSTT